MRPASNFQTMVSIHGLCMRHLFYTVFVWCVCVCACVHFLSLDFAFEHVLQEPEVGKIRDVDMERVSCLTRLPLAADTNCLKMAM